MATPDVTKNNPVVPATSNGQTAVQLGAAAGVSQQEIASESAKYPDLNPDALVGNILSSRPKPQTATLTSDTVRADGVDNATRIGTATPTAAPVPPAVNPTVPGQAPAAPDLSNDPYMRLLENMKTENDARVTRQKEQLEYQKNQMTEQAKVQGAQNIGTNTMALVRGGGFSAGSGQSYIQSIQRNTDAKLADIDHSYQQALQQAQDAQTDLQFKLAGEALNRADQLKRDFLDEQQRGIDNAVKYAQLQQYERDNAADTLSSLAQSGVSNDYLPEGYMEDLSQQLNIPVAAAFSLLDVARDEKQAEKQISDLAKVETITGILKDLPAGTPLSIGEETYYGFGGLGGMEVDANGYGTIASVDPTTGEFSVKQVGFVGKPKDGWRPLETAQGFFSYNDATGQAVPLFANGGDWDEILPTGSTGGQCGEFVNDLTGLGVGDSLDSKISKTTFPPDSTDVQIGDVMITNEGGWTGHCAIVENISTDPNGKLVYSLMESNYNKDEKVTHGRTITQGDTRIKGFGRGQVNQVLQTGTGSKRSVQLMPKGEEKATELSITQLERISSSADAKKIESSKNLLNKLKTYQALVNEYGIETMPTVARDEMNAAYNELKIAYKTAADLGAIQTPDVPLIEGAIPNATDTGVWANVKRIGQFTGLTKNKDKINAALEIVRTNAIQEGKKSYDSLTSRYDDFKDDPYLQELGEGIATIRVRDKATGQTGIIPVEEFEAGIYDKL